MKIFTLQPMKRNTKLVAIFLLLSLQLMANDSVTVVLKKIQPDSQHPVLYQMIGQILNSYHYRKLVINDEMSSNLLDNYLENLDPAKVYFLKSDIDGFNKFRTLLDDDLMKGNVQKAFDIYNIYQERVQERINYSLDLMKTEFDFSAQDSIYINRDGADWPASFKEYDMLWKRKVKYECLQLKAENRDFKTYSAIIIKRYQNLLKQMSKAKSEDVFSAFANSLTEIADPHTNYFSPRVAEDFNTTMSLSLEGIGATLQTDNEYTKIREVVPGGPADKSKLVHANDKIVGVGQGKDGEIVNVLDWRLDDVVSLIRGKKGTVVRLEIISPDAVNNKTKVIEIVRDKIVLEDQGAKGTTKVIERNGKKYNLLVVTVPTFYLNFDEMKRGDANYKSTTRDVKKIISEAKKTGIDAVVIDLRNNGGGALQEAVDLTGIFIKKGPIVQVKDAYGTIKSEDDRDASVTWDGPLMVLVNRFSASASEIFAAAIQDYHRGLILGEKTFGKGTVQNPLDLNQFMMMDGKKLGQVKITIAKFYRISGGSTQMKGVIPDIEFPSIYSSKEYGEEASKYALPYDEIQPMSFEKVQEEIPLNMLKKKHEQRMSQSEEYAFLKEDITVFDRNLQRKYATLNETAYKAEIAEADKRKKSRDEAHKRWKEDKKTDANLILDESGEIIMDWIQK